MKVTLVGPAPPLRGGIAAHTHGLARALVRRGHRASVIGYRRQYPRLLFPGSSELGGGAVVGDAVIDTLAPRTWLKARRRLDRDSADLVVAQWWHPIAAPALRAVTGIVESRRLVVICHNLLPHERFPAAATLARGVLRRSATVIVHSASMAERLASACPATRTLVCPLPLLVEAGETSVPRAEARRRLGLDAAAPTAVFLGNVRRYKGVDLLIDAWARARLPEAAALVVAGDSYLGRGRLRAMVAASPRSASIRVDDRYLEDEEIRLLLDAADVVVFPYREASQSGLLPLALAVGAGVVVSTAGGLAEQARGHARAHVFRSGRSNELAEALSAALHDRWPVGAGAAAGIVGEPQGAAGSDSWLPLVQALERLAGRTHAGEASNSR